MSPSSSTAAAECALTTIKDHFSDLAAQYAAFRPLYPAALFDRLAAACGERRLAWDCACGSGQASIALAERFEQVIATDASAAQISAARPHPRVLYRVAPAEASGLEPASVDLVSVAQALHWFDLAAFYREARRVLKPAGILAAWSYGTLHVEGREVDLLVQDFYGRVLGPYWPAERRIVERGYDELPFPFAALELPRFEMTERWSLPHLLGYVRSWSATGRYVAHTGVDPVIALERRLAGPWGEPDTARLVTWPLSLRVGRV